MLRRGRRPRSLICHLRQRSWQTAMGYGLSGGVHAARSAHPRSGAPRRGGPPSRIESGVPGRDEHHGHRGGGEGEAGGHRERSQQTYPEKRPRDRGADRIAHEMSDMLTAKARPYSPGRCDAAASRTSRCRSGRRRPRRPAWPGSPRGGGATPGAPGPHRWRASRRRSGGARALAAPMARTTDDPAADGAERQRAPTMAAFWWKWSRTRTGRAMIRIRRPRGHRETDRQAAQGGVPGNVGEPRPGIADDGLGPGL